MLQNKQIHGKEDDDDDDELAAVWLGHQWAIIQTAKSVGAAAITAVSSLGPWEIQKCESHWQCFSSL